MKNILIVGGSGFIGSNLIKTLKNKKNKRIFSTIYKKNKFKKFSGVQYFKGNLLNFNFCKKITKNIDEVYMCAAFTSGAKVIEKNPLKFVHDNTIMNLNILKASADNKIKKFIFISSSIVYPNSKKEMRENDVNYSFFNKYYNASWMKLYSERVCEMYKNKFKVLIVRPANIYGPYDKFDEEKSKVIPSLIRKFENSKTVEVWGNGKEIKDFIFIDDFINILLILKNKFDNFSIINIASGKKRTISDLVKILNLNYPHKKINFVNNKLTMIPVRKINISKMKSLSKYNFKYNLEKGIKKTIQWYKENLKKK